MSSLLGRDRQGTSPVGVIPEKKVIIDEHITETPVEYFTRGVEKLKLEMF